MRYQIIDLHYSDSLGRIDDEPLRRALGGHEVLSTSEQFYVHQGVPHLVVAVQYRLPGSGNNASLAEKSTADQTKRARREKRDPKELLPEKDHATIPA